MAKKYLTTQDEVCAGLQRRKELIIEKCIPFEHEIIKAQGDCFGDILMKQMTTNATKLMHHDKIHQMPNKNLWISPESRINKKVCITNASIFDKIKATSHKGILSIGVGIEKKIERKRLLDLKKTLNENSEFERFECEQRMQFALKDQHEYYKQKMIKLTEKFNEKFKYQKELLQNHYQKKCNKIVHKIMSDCCYSVTNALAAENNKINCCNCKKTRKRKIKKITTGNKYTSCNIEIKEDSKLILPNTVFNNKSLCNMMHFVLCGEKLESLKLIKNMKISFATELKNIKLSIYKIIENITNEQQPRFSAIQNDKISLQSANELTCYSECFDTLCCLCKKLNNILLCIDKRIETFDVVDQSQNIMNTCNVIVPKSGLHQLFCTCVSSSLDSTTTKSVSSDGFGFPDFTSPNVNWNRNNENQFANVVCQCNKKLDFSDTSSSSSRSTITLNIVEDICPPLGTPAIEDRNTCSSTSSY